ncbi:MAG: TauD/TfdA family dioxygenase [Verrucomicrobiota bacterium]
MTSSPHPAAWTAATLSSSPDWIQTFTPEECAELERVAIGESDSLVECSKRIPSFQDHLEHGLGAILLRGLPDLSAKPEAHTKEMFLRFAAKLGTPLSQSPEGNLLFSVKDSGLSSDDPRSRGPNTRKKLSFHTDRCDVIAFLCLQPAASGGENQIVSSLFLYHHLLRTRPDLCETLCEPFHYLRHTMDQANELPYVRQPIFSHEQGHFAASYLRVLIDRAQASGHPEIPPLTNIQSKALDALEEAASNPAFHHRFRLNAGDILLLNNWVTFHRRTEFTDHPHPNKKRHFLRAWLSMPNSRPLSPQFLENFGAVEAGAVRGGIQSFKKNGSPL